MIKYFFSFFLIFTISVYSQERVNGTKVDFINETEILKRPTLHFYNEKNEEWDTQKELFYNDFNKFSFLKINYENVNYYVLKLKTSEVLYRYPNLKMNPYVNKFLIGFIFEEEEYNNLKNYTDASCLFYEIRTSTINDEDFRFKVVNYLKSKTDYLKDTFKMKVKKENDKIIRFRIPENLEANFIPFDKKYYEISKGEFDKLLKL